MNLKLFTQVGPSILSLVTHMHLNVLNIYGKIDQEIKSYQFFKPFQQQKQVFISLN